LTYPAPKGAYGYVRNMSRIEVANGDFSLVDKRDGDFMEASTHLVPALAKIASESLGQYWEAMETMNRYIEDGAPDSILSSQASQCQFAQSNCWSQGLIIADAMESAGMEVPK